MGRPLRYHEPGRTYLVTTRCHEARFFLKPDPDLNQAVLEWLTRAQKHYPAQRIYAVCAMSNHLHLIVHDADGALAAWAAYFLGNLARAVNRIRGRSGSFYERRYSAEPILDDGALIDRLVYVVTNPVKAGLCKTADSWPGVLLVADHGRPLEMEVTWVDRDATRAQRASARRRGQSPADVTCYQSGRLVVDCPHPSGLENEGAALRDAISACEQEIARGRRTTGSGFLTRAKILAQDWRHAPAHPKRSPRPLCHATDPEARKLYWQDFQAFVASFRIAREQLRRVGLGVSFPAWCYPPGGRLVRPGAATA